MLYLELALAEADCRPLCGVAEQLEVEVGDGQVTAGFYILPNLTPVYNFTFRQKKSDRS